MCGYQASNLNNKISDIDDAFKQALDLLSRGEFAEMTDICRCITEVDPLHFRAFHGLGFGLHKTGKSDEGITCIRKAIEINPSYFEAYNNLGNILRETNIPGEALELFQKGRALRSDSPLIHYNIGNALRDLDRNLEAIDSYHEALRLAPDYLDARNGLALSLRKLERNEEAEALYHEILHHNPEHCESLYGFATLLQDLDRPKEAYEYLQRIIVLQPDYFNAYLALGNLLRDQVNFGMGWAHDETLECYLRASEIRPENVEILVTIGSILCQRLRIDESLERLRMALSLNAENEIARSCLLFCSQYHPLLTMEELYNESILWPRFCTKDIQCTTNHPNLPIPDRPIKIGLVSADFKIHPVGYYLLSYMHNHDSEKYPVVCYSNSELVDIFTERFKTYADEWRDVTKLTDNELFSLIISDGVDILVDLSGHTEGNRLRLFAMKPAPVQATWIGFFFTTGLSEIDYILMDDVSVLPGEERYFSEKVYRLPQTRFCYEPPALAPDVIALPFTRNNYITFGSFNNLAKVTHQVIQLWARVLSEIPNSRLLLKTASLGSERVREEVATTFESFGISRERLILRNESSYVDMLGEYGDMDIALDPFPFNGGLTSCEALWMGVPVITLAGNRPIARQTTSFIKCIDIDDLIAKNEAEYVELAMKWSNNINKLMEIRKLLRSKMQSSLLCDGRRFTVNLESAFRWMWVDWCKSG